MNNRDVLKALFPIEMGSVFDDDIAIEGKHLDDLEASAAGLIAEMFPDTADKTIADWERVYDITPPEGATLNERRSAVLQQVRKRGSLTPRYFIDLAAAAGFAITIEEVVPHEPGYGVESIWIWRVHVIDSGNKMLYFEAGVSRAGDRLLDWEEDATLERIIRDLKPAWTEVYFVYEQQEV